MIKCWRETRWKKRATFIPSCARQTTSKITRNGIMFCQCRISDHQSLNTVTLPTKKCDFWVSSSRLFSWAWRQTWAAPSSGLSCTSTITTFSSTSTITSNILSSTSMSHFYLSSYPNYMHFSSPMVRSNIHNIIAAVFIDCLLNYIRMKWVDNEINTGHCWHSDIILGIVKV